MVVEGEQDAIGNERETGRGVILNGQGRFAAHNIAKPDEPVKYDKVPIFWSSVGKGLRYLGTGAGFDETYTDGDVAELKVSYTSVQQRGNLAPP
jgi:hypothetical protein